MFCFSVLKFHRLRVDRFGQRLQCSGRAKQSHRDAFSRNVSDRFVAIDADQVEEPDCDGDRELDRGGKSGVGYAAKHQRKQPERSSVPRNDAVRNVRGRSGKLPVK